MHILTSYTNIVIFCVILFGCASQQTKPEKPSPEAIDKALKQTSNSDIQKYHAAINLLNEGKLDSARTILSEFTEERPELAGPWANLGLISIKENHLDEAKFNLQKALARNPDLAQALNLMGYIELKRGHIIKARDDYLKAIEIKDDYALAHYNLALLYDIYIQDIAKAVAHYQKYLALTKYKDKRTADWLDQLKASLKKS